MIQWIKNALFGKEVKAEAQVIEHSVAEFGLLMRQRLNSFSLYKYEQGDDASVLWLDPVAVFVDRNEEVGRDGRLINPPRVYVIHYNAELHEIELLPASIHLLNVLGLKRSAAKISNALQALRGARRRPFSEQEARFV